MKKMQMSVDKLKSIMNCNDSVYYPIERFELNGDSYFTFHDDGDSLYFSSFDVNTPSYDDKGHDVFETVIEIEEGVSYMGLADGTAWEEEVVTSEGDKLTFDTAVTSIDYEKAYEDSQYENHLLKEQNERLTKALINLALISK